MNVTAEVQNAIQYVTSPAVVEFGDIQSGLISVVDSNPSGASDDNASAPQRAQITIENAVTDAFDVTFGNGILAQTSGSHTVDFTTSLFVVSGTDGSNSQALTSGSTIQANGNGDDIVLSIGGQLDAVDAIHAGSYSTTETNGQSVSIDFTLTTL